MLVELMDEPAAAIEESPMECISNRTFDEIRVGDSSSTVRTLGKRDMELFTS
jgi:hypothetical protein